MVTRRMYLLFSCDGVTELTVTGYCVDGLQWPSHNCWLPNASLVQVVFA